jgi:predicted nucleic acid-binding protein
MKYMTGLVFVDANIFVYARDPRDSAKQSKAREWIRFLWDTQRGRTSAQALSEFYDTVTRKFQPGVARDDAWEEVQSYLAWNPQSVDTHVLMRANEVERRYQLNWWDCLIVAAAQVQGCVLLLSEDMQDGADYGGIILRSPFTLGVSDEASSYAPLPMLASRHRGRGRPRRNPAHSSGTSG